MQYIKNVAAARVAAGKPAEEGDDGPPQETKTSPNDLKNETSTEPPKQNVRDDPSGWNYGAQRKDFLVKQKANGVSYKDATTMWDNSHEKALLLSTVSVPELKRRKFIPAGSTSNPWSERINGK